MATVRPSGVLDPLSIALGTNQTGNTDTTNTLDRGNRTGPILIEIVSTVGATPTVTVNILGSVDGTNFFNVAYADVASPETVSVASFTITTATTTRKIVRPNHPWRYLKLNYSANTNVTLSATAYVF